MSSKKYSEWVCDYCSTKVKELGNNQPPKWARLILVTPPKADINSHYAKYDIDLCGSCYKIIEEFIRPVVKQKRSHSV